MDVIVPRINVGKFKFCSVNSNLRNMVINYSTAFNILKDIK